ncbi:TonB-dependent receptor [Oleiagrimonas sp. C23AA]|uniref:TonB-dependent receptor n=1 Tax=Oleiagrimonas sp. C23AA TaxID=2719047 RepID=UPI001F0E1A1B|nr:TonB-dependent receptor [Oleiagrimonas sp. C23AA]
MSTATSSTRSEESNIDLWPGGGVVDQAGNTYSGYFMPQQFSTSQTQLDLKNTGVQATMQFKPTDNFLLTANYFHFQEKRTQITNVFEMPEWNLSNSPYSSEQGRLLAPNGLTFDSSGTIVTGANYQLPAAGTGCNATVNPSTGEARQAVDVCSTQTPWLTGNYSVEKATSQVANITGEWSGDYLSGSFNIGRTWAKGGPSVEFGAAAKPRVFVNGHWEDGSQISQWTLNGKPTMTASPDVLQNMLNGIGQMDLGSTGSGFVNTDTSQNFAQLDFTWTPNVSWLDSIQFGAKYRDTHAHQQGGEIRWYCPGTTEQFQSCDPGAGTLQSSFLLPHSLTSNTRVFSDSIFPGLNFPAYYNYLNNTYDTQRLMHPDDQSFIKEAISAAYIQANYNTGNWRGNVGVRFVSTMQDVYTADKITKNHAVYYHDANGNILICPNSGVNAGGGACAPGDFQYLPRSQQYTETYAIDSERSRYTNVLPSFNIVYSLPHNVVLRLTGSKAIARANYGDLAQLGNLTYYSQDYYNDRKQFGSPLPGWYGSGANKNLKPFTATQFDFGAAWYYAPNSVIGMNLFDKTVKNFVVPVTVTNRTVNVDGTPEQFMQYSTNANGRKGTSKGVEIFTQHDFSNGIGVIANYTLNKTNETAVSIGDTKVGESALIGSAKFAGNLSVYYQNDKLLLRASSNWTGRVVNGLVAGLTEYQAPYHQVDLNGDYEFNKHFMVTASIMNLTRSTTRSYLGDDTKLRLNSLGYSGRQYYLGVTYKFGPGK